MHRSKLSAVMVDVPASMADQAVAFWSGALGVTDVQHSSDSPTTDLGREANGLRVTVQRIGGPPRFHLDLESDDVAAEVARLQRLGAHEVGQVNDWTVLHDPSGLLLCVAPVESPDFDSRSVTWHA